MIRNTDTGPKKIVLKCSRSALPRGKALFADVTRCCFDFRSGGLWDLGDGNRPGRSRDEQTRNRFFLLKLEGESSPPNA